MLNYNQLAKNLKPIIISRFRQENFEKTIKNKYLYNNDYIWHEKGSLRFKC
jgi:hypothetical protein